MIYRYIFIRAPIQGFKRYAARAAQLTGIRLFLYGCQYRSTVNLASYGNDPRSPKRSQGRIAGGEERDPMTLAPGELKYLVEDVDDDGTWQRKLTKFLQTEAKNTVLRGYMIIGSILK